MNDKEKIDAIKKICEEMLVETPLVKQFRDVRRIHEYGTGYAKQILAVCDERR